MDQHDDKQARELDRQWDRHLDGRPGKDADGEIIEKIHRSDRTPGPPAELKTRVEADLRAQHPGAARPAGKEESNVTSGAPDAAPDRSSKEPIPLSTSSASRKWGELAAIVVILVVAIVATALYGDDAFDFAQQLASGDDDYAAVDIGVHRTELAREGEVSGLTFDEAQALTPMQIVVPTYLPEGLSEPEFEVSGHAYRDGLDRFWPFWQTYAQFSAGDDLPPIEIDFVPALGTNSLGMPLPTDVGRHQNAPSGNFNVIQIDDHNLLRSEELTDDGEAISHFRWIQGGVEIMVSAPVVTDLSDEQREWVDMPDAPVSYEDVESMIGSMLEHGDLDDGSEHIATQNVSLAEALEWRPTAPFSETLPEPLELLSANANPNGPTLFMSHPDDAVQDIWLHSFVGIGATRPGGSAHEELMDAVSGELVDVDGVPVSRFVLTDPLAPEVVEFLLTSRTMEHLLPWISGDHETSVIAYLWDIAGMSFFMGVEVEPQYVEFSDAGEIRLSDVLPEDDWFALINDQQRVAEETLDPEELFPMFAREATEEEQAMLSDLSGLPGYTDQIESVRFIREQDGVGFYAGLTGNHGVCVLTGLVRDGEELIGSSGCNPLWSAAELGAGIYSSGRDGPAILAQILPPGYDEVVDENGDIIALVEDQLFAKTFEAGESRPADLIARGPDGELYLGLGTSGRTERETSPGLDAP